MRRKLSSAEAVLARRQQELTLLANLLQEQEDDKAAALDQLQWLLKVHECIAGQKWWWALLPRAERRRRQLARLQRTGIFDSDAYLKRYPDVAAAGMDPLHHYLHFGMAEGRSRRSGTGSDFRARRALEASDVAALEQSGAFDADFYRSEYPDATRSGMDPAEHFLWVGAKLGRAPARPASGSRSHAADLDVLFIDGTNGTSSTPYRVTQIAAGLGERGLKTRCEKGEALYDSGFRPPSSRFVVIHRAPYQPPYPAFVDRMRSKGSVIVYDVDDLVFDEAAIPHIDGLNYLSEADRQAFIAASRAYRNFALNADMCTATTGFLVDRLSHLGKAAYRVRNSISSENLDHFEGLPKRSATRPSPFVIGYYSGTKTHQADFAVMAPALVQFMKERPDVVFRLIGELELDAFSDLLTWEKETPQRVERVGLMPHNAMLRDQLSCDLIVAPLEVGNPFCEAKSELKFFEASLARCPVIASATRTFAEATGDGRFARLARTGDDWLAAFREVHDDYEMAIARADQAFDHVRNTYSQAYASKEALEAYEDFVERRATAAGALAVGAAT